MGTNEDSVLFFSSNVERVDAVINTLADEKSKKMYLGMIKYRQTRRRNDFPLQSPPKNQYFIKEFALTKNEVFIDGGAFIGDTISKFLACGKGYRQIIAFEPGTVNFKKLTKTYGKQPRISLINACICDYDGEVSFCDASGMNSRITDSKRSSERDWGGSGVNNIVNSKTIDGLEMEMVSFIKMDIEGAELNALKGAEKTILRDKPKLAICIYHSDEDMISIAEYIHKLVPEYKLYVRHHGVGYLETVLYATV